MAVIDIAPAKPGYVRSRDFKSTECLPRCGATEKCPEGRVSEERNLAPHPEATVYENVLVTLCLCVLQRE